jgi:hypothetical protein
MRRFLLFVVLLPFLTPCLAQAREGLCPQRPGDRVVDRSGDLVVRIQVRRDSVWAYRACLRSVGKDRIIGHRGSWVAASVALERYVFSGRYVASFQSTFWEDGKDQRSVSVIDLVTGRRVAPYVSLSDGFRIPRLPVLGEAALGPEGHLAWVEDGRLLALAAREIMPVAAGAVSGLRFEGDVLHWNAGGEERAHRLRDAVTPRGPEPVRCALPVGAFWKAIGTEARVSRRSFRRDGSWVDAWRACLAGWTAPMTLLGTTRASEAGGTLGKALVAGTMAALVVEREDADERVLDAAVTVHDLATGRRLVEGRALGAPGETPDVIEATLSPAGDLAVAARVGETMRLIVVREAGTVVVAEAPAISALRIDRESVGWVQDGMPRTAPLAGLAG